MARKGITQRSKYTGGFRVDLDSIAWERVNLEPTSSNRRYNLLQWPSASSQLKGDLELEAAVERRLASVWLYSQAQLENIPVLPVGLQ